MDKIIQAKRSHLRKQEKGLREWAGGSQTETDVLLELSLRDDKVIKSYKRKAIEAVYGSVLMSFLSGR